MCSDTLRVSFRTSGENLPVRDLASGQDYTRVEELQRNSRVDKAEVQAASARTAAEAEVGRQTEMRNAKLELLLLRRR